MPGRGLRAPARRRGASERAGVTLAVYHASADVEQHVAALRRAKRFALACFPQRAVSSRVSRAGFDGVLWELAPGKKPDWHRVAAIARGAPVLSYSMDAGRDMADLSRAIGFPSHLKAPLSPIEVEQQFLVARLDLAARLRYIQRTLRVQLSRIDTLREMIHTVNATLDPQRVAELLAGRAAEWIPVPCWVVVGGGSERNVRVLANRGLVAPLDEPALDIGAWVMGHGEDYMTANVAADQRIPSTAGVAALAFPLNCRGRTVGALVGLDRRSSAREPAIAPAALNALRSMLAPAALALDNAERLQRAEALSVTDDLTQLYNMRYLSQALGRETKRASRSGRPLSLLFLDLDGFKSVNDAHGHLCGSRALVEAGSVIRTSARETDVVARYGGDEFALVLPDTGSEGAIAVGQRVRDRIAAHRFLAGEGLDIRLTVSVGVATLPDVAASADGLIKAADQAMYWVKEHGKNGLYVAPSAVGEPKGESGRYPRR